MSKMLSRELTATDIKRRLLERQRQGAAVPPDADEAQAVQYLEMLEQTSERLDVVDKSLESFGSHLHQITEALHAGVATHQAFERSQRRYVRTVSVLTCLVILTAAALAYVAWRPLLPVESPAEAPVVNAVIDPTSLTGGGVVEAVAAPVILPISPLPLPEEVADTLASAPDAPLDIPAEPLPTPTETISDLPDVSLFIGPAEAPATFLSDDPLPAELDPILTVPPDITVDPAPVDPALEDAKSALNSMNAALSHAASMIRQNDIPGEGIDFEAPAD